MFLSVAVILLLVSCSSAKVIGGYKSPDFNKKFDKVLVVFNGGNSRKIEDTFVSKINSELKSKGIDNTAIALRPSMLNYETTLKETEQKFNPEFIMHVTYLSITRWTDGTAFINFDVRIEDKKEDYYIYKATATVGINSFGESQGGEKLASKIIKDLEKNKVIQ